MSNRDSFLFWFFEADVFCCGITAKKQTQASYVLLNRLFEHDKQPHPFLSLISAGLSASSPLQTSLGRSGTSPAFSLSRSSSPQTKGGTSTPSPHKQLAHSHHHSSHGAVRKGKGPGGPGARWYMRTRIRINMPWQITDLLFTVIPRDTPPPPRPPKLINKSIYSNWGSLPGGPRSPFWLSN